MIERSDLKELLPKYYDKVREMQVLMDVEDKIADETADNLQRVQDNFNIQTAHEEVVAYYEAFYNINKKVDDTLQQRRFRVLVRMVSQPPFTPGYLQERLEMLGTWARITERPQHYELEIETNLTGQGEVEELPFLFNTIIPSNLVVTSKNRIDIESKQTLYFGHTALYTNLYTLTNDFNTDYDAQGIMNTGITAQTWSIIATK